MCVCDVCVIVLYEYVCMSVCACDGSTGGSTRLMCVDVCVCVDARVDVRVDVRVYMLCAMQGLRSVYVCLAICR